jgi:hypothetical protein
VSIGRVEVRAVPAPAAKKTSSQRTPIMTLEQYLQRGRGGRA